MKYGPILLEMICGVLIGLSAPAQAATYVLEPDGSGDFPTIQDAVDQTFSGGVLLFAPGAGAPNDRVGRPIGQWPARSSGHLLLPPPSRTQMSRQSLVVVR